MVLTWQQEPTTALNGCMPLPPEHVQAARFPETARFVNDGTTREDRLPNYLNKADPQGNERRHGYAQAANTCTHTQVQDRLATTKAVLELATQVEQSLWSPPAMKSDRVKSATNKSLLSNDVRFEVLRDSCSLDIGPGHYWQPGQLGLAPPDLPSRGASPARDPLRASRPFASPPRGELFACSEAPDRVYQSPDFKPTNSTMVPWSSTPEPQRAPVADYRYNTRQSEAARQVPVDAEYEHAAAINQASQRVRVGDVAARCDSPTHTFKTKEARLGRLPNCRVADVRLSRLRSDEDPSALGPGSYGPFTSLGAARRSTYRLFAPPAPNGIIGGEPAQPTFVKMGVNVRRGSTSASSSFANTPRGRQAGPYAWAHDSSLTKIY